MSSWLIGVAVLLAVALIAAVVAVAMIGWMLCKQWMQKRGAKQIP